MSGCFWANILVVCATSHPFPLNCTLGPLLWVWAVSLSTTKLISRSVTPNYSLSAILSLIGFSKLSPPSPFSALPAVMLIEASPKAISERTSYLRVRLEFLRYPQLIRYHFNGSRFGPPWSFTFTSAWPWVGHPVSGRIHLTCRPVQTCFRFGFTP